MAAPNTVPRSKSLTEIATVLARFADDDDEHAARERLRPHLRPMELAALLGIVRFDRVICPCGSNVPKHEAAGPLCDACAIVAKRAAEYELAVRR